MLDANKHTHIYIKYMYVYIYIICLFETIVSKAWLSSSVFLLYPMRSMGESIGIGFTASSTSTGPQAKTTEPTDSIKL